MKTSLAALVALSSAAGSVLAGAIVKDVNNLPHTTESGQFGYNDCTKYGDSPTANCQTVHIQSLDDFCLWAPPTKDTIGNAEPKVVAWCTKAGHGARLMPKGTIKSAHMQVTADYIQITGTLKGTNINIPAGDDGGELDPHGAEGNGNPVGGIVLTSLFGGKLQQVKEWTSFISDDEFCFKACRDGPNAWKQCQHIYDVMGCYWNVPGNYGGGFDTCKANVLPFYPGEYPVVKNGKTSTSTWKQGVNPTPAARSPAKSSQCKAQGTIAAAAYTTQRVTTTTKATTTKATTTAKAPGATAGGKCKATSECSQAIPANSHRYCHKTKGCQFVCNKNYKLNSKKNGCVKA
ncbi:hypothetical protein JCM6882_000447 [Rhodosporidiobolus microsporus]